MEAQSLSVESRSGRGKGAARKLRASGKIPAIFYGKGVEPKPLAVSPKDLSKALLTPYRRNVLLKLQDNGTESFAMLKELAKHPVTANLLHADFYQVNLEHPVCVQVPVEAKGRASGVQKGGKLRMMFRSLPVKARPELIPSSISIDVTSLDLNQSFTVADLVVADGVEVQLPHTQKIVLIGGEQRKAKPGEESEEDAKE